MKRLSLLALGVGVATSMHAEMATTTMKIGVVEIQKIFTETHEGKEVHEIIVKKQKELTNELQKDVQSYMAKRQEFEKLAKEGLESEAALMKKRMALESKERELKEKEAIAAREFEYFQHEMQQKRMAPFRERIKSTIESQAHKDGLDIVLVRETGEAIYVNPRLDLTNTVIKQLDSHYVAKKEKKAEAPAAAHKVEAEAKQAAARK